VGLAIGRGRGVFGDMGSGLMRQVRGVAGLLAMMLASPAMAGDIDLVPHRAIYSVKLGATRGGTGITDIRGAMVFELAQTCDSWTLQQRARFEMTDMDGDAVQNEVNFTSWEAVDGRAYGFSLRSLRDGELVEDARGKANLEKDGSGEAIYTSPELRAIELPVGTRFPIAHTALLIKAGLEGRLQVTVPLFLGEREDEPLMVHALITGRVDPPNGADPLRQGPAWRVHMAFHGMGDESLPVFEMIQTLHRSGLVSEVTVQYDDFSMIYSLERAEVLVRPAC
jgi:EipB-like